MQHSGARAAARFDGEPVSLNLNPYQARTLLYLAAAHVDGRILAGRRPQAPVVELLAYVT
jgi:hypothetical protein